MPRSASASHAGRAGERVGRSSRHGSAAASRRRRPRARVAASPGSRSVGTGSRRSPVPARDCALDPSRAPCFSKPNVPACFAGYRSGSHEDAPQSRASVRRTVALLAGHGVGPDLPGSDDHHDRAVRGRRPDRYRGPPDRRADDREPWPAGDRRECRRRRRHAGRAPRRHRRPGRLHAAAAPYRPGDQRLPVPQAALQPGRRLRADRAGHRRADDDRGRGRTSSPPRSAS